MNLKSEPLQEVHFKLETAGKKKKLFPSARGSQTYQQFSVFFCFQLDATTDFWKHIDLVVTGLFLGRSEGNKKVRVTVQTGQDGCRRGPEQNPVKANVRLEVMTGFWYSQSPGGAMWSKPTCWSLLLRRGPETPPPLHPSSSFFL